MGPLGNDCVFPSSHHKNPDCLRSVWESSISFSLLSPQLLFSFYSLLFLWILVLLHGLHVPSQPIKNAKGFSENFLLFEH